MSDQIKLSNKRKALFIDISDYMNISSNEFYSPMNKIQKSAYERCLIDGILTSSNHNKLVRDYISLSIINDSIKKL